MRRLITKEMLRIGWTVACFGLLLLACSDEKTPPVPTKPAAKPVTLQLQWVTQAQFAGYYVALEKGWYAEEGIDLSIKPGGPDIIPVELVASGSRDFGTAWLCEVAAGVERKLPILSIAQILQSDGLIMMAHKKSGIKTPKDFIGKRIGVWFGNFETQFNALLAKEKLSPQDMEIVFQGWSIDRFLKGDLDVAAAMIYNEYLVALENGIPADELNVIDYRSYGLEFPGDTLFTSQKLLAADPDLCRSMVRASLKGWQYAVANPEEAVDIVLKHDASRIQKRDHQLLMMREIAKLVQVPDRSIGQTDREAAARMMATLHQYGVLTQPLKPEDIFRADLVTANHR